MFSEATVKVRVGDRIFHEVAEGNGPVNALNRALRKAIGLLPAAARRASDRLQGAHPRQRQRHGGHDARPDRLRRRRAHRGRPSGYFSTNIIEARSWIALADRISVEYYILPGRESHRRRAAHWQPRLCWAAARSTPPITSAAYVDSIGAGTHMHADFGSGLWEGGPIGIPFVVVAADQPPVAIVFTAYGDESDAGPYPVPPNAPIEGGGRGDRRPPCARGAAGRLYAL
jgi:hypothetical protein